MTAGSALAEQLAAAVAAADMTQAELARRAGVTRAYVGRLLAGTQAAPTPDVVEALATALGLPAVDRLRLFLAAGLMPADLVGAASSPGLAHLLVLLSTTTSPRRAQIERVLVTLAEALTTPAGA